MLKRRFAVASLLGFAALFGLAAQHTVASSAGSSSLPSTSAAATPTTFFDQRGDGFAFDDQGAGLDASAVPSPPPVTQSSVS